MSPAGNTNDPFGDSGAGERTVIGNSQARPRPAAPGPFAPQPPAASAPAAEARPSLAAATQARSAGPPIDMNDLIRGMGSPLAAAAVPLLGLVARLRNTGSNVNVASVRDRVFRELHTYARAGREAGAQPEMLRAAHYALSATVDDVVMNTPWGAHSDWRNRTMVNEFHKDVEGGERFYAYLAKMMEAPAANRPVLQMMYECLSLGFEGRYRIHQRGPAEHAVVREKVWQALRNVAGPLERELSPDWKGVDAPARGQKRTVPVWVVAALAAGVAFLAFCGLLMLLSVRAEGPDAKSAQLLPLREIRLPISARQPPPPPPPPPLATAVKFRQFLDKEIAAGKVAVDDNGRAMKIVINFRDMFPSGEATLRPELDGLLVRIGTELRNEPGRVIVSGHTDNVPIATLRFPNNLALSKARSDAALAALANAAGDRSRFVALAKADSEPVASNATADGQARNRRIEIVLERAE